MKEAFQGSQIQTGNESEDRKNSLQIGSGEFPAENPKESIQPNWKSRVESELLLNQIVQNIEQVIWLRENSSGQIVYVSPAFETVWGRSCDSLYADPFVLIESVHPEDRVQVMVARPHSNHKPFNQAYRILRPDGSLRWIFSRTFLIHNETAESNYLFCIAQDITDQKQVELALRRTLDRTREQFDLSRKMSLARK
ncbi:MAG: PAS domain-containing protein, partial [Anaerolineaceae bacterium]